MTTAEAKQFVLNARADLSAAQSADDNHRAWLRMHTEFNSLSYFWRNEGEAWQDAASRALKHAGADEDWAAQYVRWVSSFVTHPDKLSKFVSLLAFNSELLDSVWKEFYKVFSAKDRTVSVRLPGDSQNQDFASYRKRFLQDEKFMRSLVFDRVKVSPNDICLVDLAASEDLPRPVARLISFASVCAIDTDRFGAVSAFAYYISGERVAVIDAIAYATFSVQGDSYRQLSYSEHGLGYCPARWMYDDPMRSRANLLKRNPVTLSLRALDWLAFSATSAKHVETYAGFPILETYERDCNYEEYGLSCSGGFLRGELEIDGELRSVNRRCPQCAAGDFSGAGTVIEKPIPAQDDATGERIGDIGQAVNFISPDVSTLEYIGERVTKAAEDIYLRIVGAPSGRNESAEVTYKNKERVRFGIESQQNVLTMFADRLARLHGFILKCAADLRYGAASDADVTCVYGSQFYLQSAEELEKEYTLAKDSGKPEFELTARQHAILETKYRDEPDELMRAQVVRDLEPHPTKTTREVIDLFAAGLTSREKATLKADFTAFLGRYEREEEPVKTTLVRVGSDAGAAVQAIQSKLNEYAREAIAGRTENQE